MSPELTSLRLFTFLEENKRKKYCLHSRHAQHGLSLVELIAVIAIIAIICAIAIIQFGAAKPQFKRQNVAQELKVAFERARFDSVKRRAVSAGEQAKVIVNAGFFTVVTDNDKNGSLAEAGDSVVTNFSAQDVSIASPLLGTSYTVYFNKRGEAVNDTGGSISPWFLVCNPSCTISGNSSNANSSNANLVLVTPTGTVNLLPGGALIPTFATPSVISVPTNSNIRSDVVIN